MIKFIYYVYMIFTGGDGMKWKSILISEASGALGKEVVFSRWKGRNYIRKYVKPANPRTSRQMAIREVWRKIVQLYHQNVEGQAEEPWNREASKLAISGFNLFISQGRKSWIRARAVEGSVQVSYHVGFNLQRARIYRYCHDDGTLADVTPEQLQEEGEFVDTGAEQGKTYTYYVADGGVLKEGDTGPQMYQVVTCYYPDRDTGEAVEAKIAL